MSSKEDFTHARTIASRQNPENGENVQQDNAEELIRLQCQFYRRMNALLAEDTAENLGRRLHSISEGAYIPATGYADAATLAGLMNLDVRSVYQQVAQSKQQKLGFGSTVFYSLASYLLAAFVPKPKPKRRTK
jgi:hypothetical protein